MTALAQVTQFVRAVREAPTMTDIGLILRDATRQFRFDHFALAQHIQADRRLGPVRLSDYPDEWVAELTREAMLPQDPVLAACERTVTPFCWSTLPQLVPMSRQQRAYMARARDAGLRAGYTVPIHLPGQASGLVSFVSRSGVLPSDSLPAAQYLACFAFEAARRLKGGDDEETKRPRLTQRQLDCLVLAARGKSNWVAGHLLGLAPDTVHKYLEHAKRRYSVSTRTELVVRALFDGQLSFGDVIG